MAALVVFERGSSSVSVIRLSSRKKPLTQLNPILAKVNNYGGVRGYIVAVCLGLNDLNELYMRVLVLTFSR